MNRVILVGLLVASHLFGGYSFVRTITIDRTKVPNTDQTNFPVLISGTYSYLKVTGSGGKVQNSSGYDIIFSPTGGCASTYDFEIERYISTTGEVAFWVRVPTITTATDTVLYICYGNPAILTFQGNINGTWNSSYRAVYHYPDGTTLTNADSTSNGANGTVTGGMTAGVGQIDGAAVDDGTGYITAAGYSSDSTSATFSAWVFLTANNGVIISSPGNSGPYMFVDGSDFIRCECATLNNPAISTETITPSTWTKIDCTFSAAPAENKIYKNGVITTLSDPGGTGGYVNGLTGIRTGAWQDASLKVTGRMDEVRITNDAKTADWILTEFNNQSSPSTFYTVGSEILMSTVLHRIRN